MNTLIKYKANLQFSDITPDFLQDFESWMVNRGKSLTTIGIYLRQLKAEIEKEVHVESPKIDLETLFLSGPTATKKQLDVIEKNRKSDQSMANEIVLVDTTILIDFYRKTDKANSVWISLIRNGYGFSIYVVSKYEINSGRYKVS